MASGFDKLSRQLGDAQKALEALDGELGEVHFDPHDPASIEAAVSEVVATIDERVGRYASNPIIAPLIEEMKETYRNAILERAAELRLENED